MLVLPFNLCVNDHMSCLINSASLPFSIPHLLISLRIYHVKSCVLFLTYYHWFFKFFLNYVSRCCSSLNMLSRRIRIVLLMITTNCRRILLVIGWYIGGLSYYLSRMWLYRIRIVLDFWRVRIERMLIWLRWWWNGKLNLEFRHSIGKSKVTMIYLYMDGVHTF